MLRLAPPTLPDPDPAAADQPLDDSVTERELRRAQAEAGRCVAWLSGPRALRDRPGAAKITRDLDAAATVLQTYAAQRRTAALIATCNQAP